MDLKVIGEVVAIIPPERFKLKNGEDRVKQTVIIQTKAEFPQELPIEFQKQNLQLIETLKIGEWIECQVNLRGHRYERDGKNRWIINLAGWRMVRTENPNVNGMSIPVNAIQNANNGYAPQAANNHNNDDDLPF